MTTAEKQPFIGNGNFLPDATGRRSAGPVSEVPGKSGKGTNDQKLGRQRRALRGVN
jgi:hypothetical protein